SNLAKQPDLHGRCCCPPAKQRVIPTTFSYLTCFCKFSVCHQARRLTFAVVSAKALHNAHLCSVIRYDGLALQYVLVPSLICGRHLQWSINGEQSPSWFAHETLRGSLARYFAQSGCLMKTLLHQ